MRLHQLKLEYLANEDRLLLRISTRSSTEVSLWLTRRCVKRLWNVLLDLAYAVPEVALQPDSQARHVLVGFRHEAAVAEADFNQHYEDVARERPLGETPLLITRIESNRDADMPTLGLYPQKGEGVRLKLDEKLLHGIIRLLGQGVARADWDLDMQLNMASVPMTAGSERPSIN